MTEQQQQPVSTIPDVIITPENSPQPAPVQSGNQRIIEEIKNNVSDGNA